MKQITIKFISQSIIIWSIFIIANLIAIITSTGNIIVNAICLLMDAYLLIDSILALKKVKKFVVLEVSRRKDKND